MSSKEDVIMGDALRRARHERGLSLEEASTATRIHVHHLDAMERGDAEALPPFLYAQGFRKIYSSYLGINYDELLPTGHAPRNNGPFRRKKSKVSADASAGANTDASPRPGPLGRESDHYDDEPRLRRYRKESADGSESRVGLIVSIAVLVLAVVVMFFVITTLFQMGQQGSALASAVEYGPALALSALFTSA